MGEGMVWAWPFKQLLEELHDTFYGLLTSLAVGDGHERALVPLLALLLAGAVGGAFTGILDLICLALEPVEDHPDRLLAQGMASGDVEELLGGLWALTS